MRHAIIIAAIVALSPIASSEAVADSGSTASAFALFGSLLQGPSQTGQPNQTCGSDTAPHTPGRSAAAPGAAFNPDGKSGTVYAGEQAQNTINIATASQYDVACFEQPVF